MVCVLRGVCRLVRLGHRPENGRLLEQMRRSVGRVKEGDTMQIPSTHDEIAGAIMAIRIEVHDEAKAEQWPEEWIGQAVRERIANLVADLRCFRRDDLADAIEQQYSE